MQPNPHHSEGACAAVRVGGGGAHDGGAGGGRGGVGVVPQATAHPCQRAPWQGVNTFRHSALSFMRTCNPKRTRFVCLAASERHLRAAASSVEGPSLALRGRHNRELRAATPRLSARRSTGGAGGARLAEDAQRCDALGAHGVALSIRYALVRYSGAARRAGRHRAAAGAAAGGRGQAVGAESVVAARKQQRLCNKAGSVSLCTAAQRCGGYKRGRTAQHIGADGAEERVGRLRLRAGQEAGRKGCVRVFALPRLRHEDGRGARARARHVGVALQLRVRCRHGLRARSAAEHTARLRKPAWQSKRTRRPRRLRAASGACSITARGRAGSGAARRRRGACSWRSEGGTRHRGEALKGAATPRRRGAAHVARSGARRYCVTS